MKGKKKFIIIAAIVLIVLYAAADKEYPGEEAADVTVEQSSSEVETSIDYSTYYVEECPIAFNCWLENDILDQPCLITDFTNTKSSAIVALRMIAVPYDAYGDKVDQESLWGSLADSGKSFTYEEKAIQPDTDFRLRTTMSAFDSMNNCRFYVYSILFEDGTEWGNHDIPQSEIESCVPYITAKYR